MWILQKVTSVLLQEDIECGCIVACIVVLIHDKSQYFKLLINVVPSVKCILRSGICEQTISRQCIFMKYGFNEIIVREDCCHNFMFGGG